MRGAAFLVLSSLLPSVVLGSQLTKDGVPQNGYPTYEERSVVYWINRARADPQTALAGCAATTCPDAACYTNALAPLLYNVDVSRASRFHANYLATNGGVQQTTSCALDQTNTATWETACTDAAASCACVGGTQTGTTSPNTRVGYFETDSSHAGESLKFGGEDPYLAYFRLADEETSDASCFLPNAGNRFRFFQSTYDGVGIGFTSRPSPPSVYGFWWVMDFTRSSQTPVAPADKVFPASSHWPKHTPTLSSGQTGFATAVNFSTTYYAPSAPSQMRLNIEGICYNMNAESALTVPGGGVHVAARTEEFVAGGTCFKYRFEFDGKAFPAEGSYVVGPDSCPDYVPTSLSVCNGVVPPSSGFSTISGSTISPSGSTISGSTISSSGSTISGSTISGSTISGSTTSGSTISGSTISGVSGSSSTSGSGGSGGTPPPVSTTGTTGFIDNRPNQGEEASFGAPLTPGAKLTAAAAFFATFCALFLL